MATERPKAIPCRTCRQLPVDAVPKTHTAAEVGEKIDKERELAVKRAVIATDKLHAARLQAKDKTIKALKAALKRIRSAKEYRTVSPGESDDL